VRDLNVAAQRFKTEAPETAVGLSQLLDRVRRQRPVLLEPVIGERLSKAEADGDQAEPFALALDLHRLCLPGETRLVAPVRTFMGQRRKSVAWRRAALHLESMALTHFSADGDAAGYDFDYLQALLSDGLKDHSVEVAALAAALAAKLIDRNLMARPEDLAGLEAAMAWSDNLFDPLPQSFAVLKTAIANALQRPACIDD
jgi:hypothetical protein